MKFDIFDLVLLGWIGYYLVLAPFTKVEESFNIQAIHDILFHGIHLSDYDHIEFPGPVPRTFIGALVLAALTKLPSYLLPENSAKFTFQLLARGILGLINGLSLVYFRHAIERLYGSRRGKAVGRWFLLFTLGQFHIIFYASRTLPNMLAFPLVLVASTWVLDYHYESALWLLSFAAAVFRSELALLAGSLGLVIIGAGKLKLITVIKAGIFGAGFGAVLSTIIDSYFWRSYPTFPELQGLLFNVVQGKSALWGVEPWDYYFSVHLPNLFGNPAIMLMGMFGFSVTPRNLQLLGLASLLFVTLYSFQPHKELRFVIYVAPIWTALAARATHYVYSLQWKRSILVQVLIAGITLTSIACVAVSVAKAQTSAENYPGGSALQAFHNTVAIEEPKTVHIDVSSCMTGANRFGQERELLIYDKTEDPVALELAWPTFDYYIGAVEDPSQLPQKEGYEWELKTSVSAFSRINGALAKDLVRQAIKNPTGALRIVESFVWPLPGLQDRVRKLWYELIIVEDTVFVYERVPIQHQ